MIEEAIFKVLQKYAEIIDTSYRTKLIDSVSSGELVNTIKTEARKLSNGVYAIELDLLDYWKWIEDGRPAGKFPPVSAMLNFVRQKPIIPKPYTLPTGKQVIPTDNQIAFLIGRKIAKDGTDGKHYLRDTIQEVIEDLRNEIQEAVAEHLELEVLEMFN